MTKGNDRAFKLAGCVTTLAFVIAVGWLACSQVSSETTSRWLSSIYYALDVMNYESPWARICLGPAVILVLLFLLSVLWGMASVVSDDLRQQLRRRDDD